MVLVHLATNQIFELNDTGARVWELLHEGVAGDALVDRLAAEFEVDSSTVQTEIESLLGELVEAGLMTS
jgi:predicted transcriptional regulator